VNDINPDVDWQLYSIQARLAHPFSPQQTSWKAQVVKDASCLPVCFIDARDVQDRLDEVMGIGGWKDEYELVPGEKTIFCRLWLNLPDRGWVPRSDIGAMSDQPDIGDKMKSAVSDALKRTAVKWGVGRYLYSMHSGWVDYDTQKKRIPDSAYAKLNAAVERAIKAHRQKYHDFYSVQPNVVPPPPKVTATPPAQAKPPSEPVLSEAQVNSLRGKLIQTTVADEPTICARYAEQNGLHIPSFEFLPERFLGGLVKRLDEIIDAEAKQKAKNQPVPSR
jgi:hypothetical protein